MQERLIGTRFTWQCWISPFDKFTFSFWDVIYWRETQQKERLRVWIWSAGIFWAENRAHLMFWNKKLHVYEKQWQWLFTPLDYFARISSCLPTPPFAWAWNLKPPKPPRVIHLWHETLPKKHSLEIFRIKMMFQFFNSCYDRYQRHLSVTSNFLGINLFKGERVREAKTAFHLLVFTCCCHCHCTT